MSTSNLKKEPSKEVVFTINKKTYKVSDNVPLDMSLSTFLRRNAQLPGTKTMCQEGGCGACIVAVRLSHAVTRQDVVYAVNSCLVPVFACHGWDVMTVEGIGGQFSGYHPLQVLLAAHNGSQCGYCSPGMVMNMFSLMENKHDLTQKEIEQAFGGNICRCTGYRPILEAFKSAATDTTDKSQIKCQDIEDMLKGCLSGGSYSIKCNPNDPCKESCLLKNQFEDPPKVNDLHQSVFIKTAISKWYRAASKREIFDIFNSIGDETYRFVAGNTAHGVYRDDKQYQNYIDINGVSELKTYDISHTKLMIGANITLTELIMVLQHVANSNPSLYHYTETLAQHVTLVANIPVRNIGTLAGNLCIKRMHNDFPSDLFLILETVGAQIIYEKEDGESVSITLTEFLSLDLNKVLLTYVVLPPLEETSHVVRTFKIMSRAQNAYAYVNAGFCFKVDKSAGFRVLQKPSLVFGGINDSFVHASETEALLGFLGSKGKGLLEEGVLKAALEALQGEIKPQDLPPAADPRYRAGLATALFYKCMLGLSPSTVDDKYRSGATLLDRPVSSSKRMYNTDKKMWPLNKPVPKIEALYQCSGEAQYVDDIPSFPRELHAALVLTTIGKGSIQSIDASPALAIPGVIAFYSAKDIPGVNSFTTGFPDDEPVFCDEKVLYNGQPLGVVLAESQQLALKAAKEVIVQYSAIEVPLLDMREVIKSKDEARIIEQKEITPREPYNRYESLFYQNEDKERVTVVGSVALHSQYHLTMELQTCLCVPVEDGMDVYSSTQWMEHVHNAVSRVLAVPAHRINMKVRRLGGGYGAKLTRSTWLAAACAVAAQCSHRPVRLVLDLETNMAAIGKRYDCYTEYKAEVVKSSGRIVKLEGSLFEDAGWSENDPVVESTLNMLASAYDTTGWNIKGSIVKTDKASNTWCRSPGSAEAIGTIEAIMENIAAVTGLHAVEVRLANMIPVQGSQMPAMFDDWISYSKYMMRLQEVKTFNNENRWKKRGITIIPMTYQLILASRYNAMVTIYAVDGTVAISHGGIECGQGINTKVVQVCAYVLGIDMSMIQVKPTDILTSPNNEGTGGSVSSESVCYAVMECCKTLLARLEPVRKLLPDGYTWQELVQKAYTEQVNLNTSYLFTSEDGVKNYEIYGVTTAEVEVDILTGQHLVTRVDIFEDAGVSISPEVDVGQVEGAFIMGLGYYTLENLVYDKQGALLTNRTWNYFPPGPLDIPIDFRIELRKNAPNPFGVLRSKATGEPPLCMSVVIPLAICQALNQIVSPPVTQAFSTPLTPEKVFLACNNDISSYKYSEI